MISFNPCRCQRESSSGSLHDSVTRTRYTPGFASEIASTSISTVDSGGTGTTSRATLMLFPSEVGVCKVASTDPAASVTRSFLYGSLLVEKSVSGEPWAEVNETSINPTPSSSKLKLVPLSTSCARVRSSLKVNL